jgi:hypothetical protein
MKRVKEFNLQPSVIILYQAGNPLKIEQMFINLDHRCMIIPGTKKVNCIDILFKIFWVFNCSYPCQLSNLYYFFELIFKINTELKPAINEINHGLITA